MKNRQSIGDMAKATGTKVVTIRYYEQIGLLPVASRTGGNYRSFTPEHVRRLRFIRRCRDLGFTLDQIRELLRLSAKEHQDCGEVDRITAEHLAEIEQKVSDLTRLADELRRLSKCCRGGGIIANCRIIEALSPEAEGASLKDTPGDTRAQRRKPATARPR
jgi:Cu(I)-responsive transcriptional regulator